MYNKYFGNYLLKKQIISPEQLKEVLRAQESTRVKLGVLAIESGLMNASQVKRIHQEQMTKDMRFGDIAVGAGYMTESQLLELLKKQRESHVLLGQILVDQEILSYESYERLLEKYKKDSGFTERELEILKSNNTDQIVGMMLENLEKPNEGVFKEYIELFIRNIVRFIDSEVIIEKPYVTDNYSYDYFAFQKIIGEHDILTGILTDEASAVKFAAIYAEEPIETMDALAKDSLGEFMNCQNGLFISNLYHKSVKCDLEPQMISHDGILKAKNQLIIVPCQLNFGKIEIVFNI